MFRLLPVFISGIYMKDMKDVLSYGHIENRKMHPHRNRGMEIVLVDRGHLAWAVDEKPEQLQSGDVFFTLPWQTHGSTTIREPKNKIYYVLFKLKKDYKERADIFRFPDVLGFSQDEQKVLAHTFCRAPRHTWHASSILKQLFPELIKCLDSKRKMDAMSSITLVRSIIMELARAIDRNEPYQPRMDCSTVKVQSLLNSLTGDLARPWTLSQMSEACGIKRTQLAKITQQLTGYPPLTYLALLRFSKACHLLVATDMFITDIAFDCGYSSCQYFADTFKKRSSMTPSAYRRDAPQIKEILASNWKNPEWRSIEEEQARRAQI
jgi:AraC-like DNA-binding protein